MADVCLRSFSSGAFTGGEARGTLLLLDKLLPHTCPCLLGTHPRRELPQAHTRSVFKGNAKLCSEGATAPWLPVLPESSPTLAVSV